MVKLVKCAAVLMLATSLQQCSYSQSSSTNQKAKMETDKKNNPVYSRTDTSKVNLSEENGKNSSAEILVLPAKKEQKERGPVSMKNLMRSGPTIAQPVEIHYLEVIQSLSVAVTSFYEPISKGIIIYAPDIHVEWKEPR